MLIAADYQPNYRRAGFVTGARVVLGADVIRALGADKDIPAQQRAFYGELESAWSELKAKSLFTANG